MVAPRPPASRLVALLTLTTALAGCLTGTTGEGAPVDGSDLGHPEDLGAVRDAQAADDLGSKRVDFGFIPDLAAPDFGQPIEDLGQPAGDLGQPLEDLGQSHEDLGQPLEDLGQPEEDAGGPPPQPRTCTLRSRTWGQGPQLVDTWRGDTERVVFEVEGLPAPALLTAARLRYYGYDMDHPGAEGWIRVNGNERMELPADEALDNVGRTFELDVTGQTVEGLNTIRFSAFDGPEGAYFQVSDVTLEVTGLGVDCEEEPPPEVVQHSSPVGVSAFAALAPGFPRAGLLTILGGLQRPFTAVLLDFGPVYDPAGVQMLGGGAVGARVANPAHRNALTDFLQNLVAATPDAAERHVQLYVLNGPGIRRAGYARAYPQGPEALDAALQSDAAVRAELQGYLAALTNAVAPWRDRVQLRLVVGLEDNYTAAGARAVRDLALAAGWPDPIGRNPCGCGYGDTQRVGDFHEDHLHGSASIAALPGGLSSPDAFSNDGWGWTLDAGGELVGDAQVVAMAAKARQTGVWFHLWYDPIQGYPIPADGQRNLRFDHAPEHLLGLLAEGLAR